MSSSINSSRFCLVMVLAVVPAVSLRSASLHFEVALKKGLAPAAQTGRLFVLLSSTNEPEPRLVLGRSGPEAPIAFARDVPALSPNSAIVLDQSSFGFPLANIS